MGAIKKIATDLADEGSMAGTPIWDVSTSIYKATSTQKPTPTPVAKPKPGYQFWNAGSRWGKNAYAIQYPENKWQEEQGRLIHRTIPGCEVGEHGGTDICRAYVCTKSLKTIGEVQYYVTGIGGFMNVYDYFPPRDLFRIQGYEVILGSPRGQCLEDAEEVLGTLKFRPERTCTDRAAFLADITIPDNTTIESGTSFIKTWRLKNVGTCTWTKEYSLGVWGKQFVSVPFDQEVLPQQTVDLSVELTAPEILGEAKWEALIMDDIGLYFGIGSIGYQPFWVQIMVVPPSTP